MLKQKIFIIPAVIAIASGALVLGVWLPSPPNSSWKWWEKSTPINSPATTTEATTLIFLAPSARADQLKAIAGQTPSLNRHRARFMLATDLLQAGQAKKAMEMLQNLENEYPVLAPHILLRKAQSYTAMGNLNQAQATWQTLLKKYPKSPVIVESLFALGKTQPEYWQKAVSQFPSHPYTVEIAQQKLAKNPHQPQLLMLIAKYGLYLNDYGNYLEKLANQYDNQLTAQEWETIAWGYWEKQDYGKAAIAYSKATRTPENLYRYARGLWLAGKVAEARQVYKRMPQQFPDAKETGLGLIRLSRLVPTKEAITYLDKVIANYPDYAPLALLDKAKNLDKLQSKQSASKVRQILLSDYSKSDAAAELRWQLARQAANAKAWDVAWQWAQQITTNNPESEWAPEAAFWVGKWAQYLGESQAAEMAFKFVLLHYPESYFAWRSAVMLGWPVGDFTTVRSLAPAVIKLPYRAEPPLGSQTLKELHLIGQDTDAWNLWQVEFKNRQNPTVSEQYTDGIMRIGIGDILEGIWMLSSLKDRDNLPEKKAYIELKHQPSYWQALYPFPYQDLIVKWSKERALNPILVTALIRQESRFTPTIISVAGAVGLMQVIPETAAEVAKKINLKKFDLKNINDNVNLGTYYLYYTHTRYNDNSLLAVASYNAGPNATASWLKRFGFTDPDLFADKITYPETKDYVRSVFGNYWNYLRIYNPEVRDLLAQHQANHR